MLTELFFLFLKVSLFRICNMTVHGLQEKKEEILLSPMTKATAAIENPKSNVARQKRHQNFDETTIADRLRTVSKSNDNHQNGVVKYSYIKLQTNIDLQ